MANLSGDAQAQLREELVRQKKKNRVLYKRQERILYSFLPLPLCFIPLCGLICLSVCTHTLLNLAEDVEIERRMTKIGIVSHLLDLLERPNVDLQILAMTFLKKLSIVEENVASMGKDIVPKLCKLVPHENDVSCMQLSLPRAHSRCLFH